MMVRLEWFLSRVVLLPVRGNVSESILRVCVCVCVCVLVVAMQQRKRNKIKSKVITRSCVS
jgi:hypothetical protein